MSLPTSQGREQGFRVLPVFCGSRWTPLPRVLAHESLGYSLTHMQLSEYVDEQGMQDITDCPGWLYERKSAQYEAA